MDYTEKLNTLNTKDDFIEFMGLLVKNLKSNPEDWENKSLEDYLHAMASWTEDSDGYYHNMNEPEPTNVNWKAFAEILAAAVVYE